MGIVESDTPLLEVKAHPEPGGQGVGEPAGRGGAVAVGNRVAGTVGMVMIRVLGQVNLPHSHGEEGEGRRGVQGVLRPTVMAAVWVIATEIERNTIKPSLS